MKNKNGITLIALIISIIVLIILAGVSISLVLGDNGVVIKASEAKTETVLGDVKETAEIIRAEYEVNNDGVGPTSRYIIERLISNKKIDSSQVEDYGDETGIGTIIVEGERINVVGNFGKEFIVSAVRKYYLTNKGNLNYIENYQITSEDGIQVENNIQTSLFASNVKEIFPFGPDNNIVYVTNDNSIYYNSGLIAENITQITNLDTGWSSTAIDFIDNNKNLYSYSRGRGPILIDENVSIGYGTFYIKENGEIYMFSISSGQTPTVNKYPITGSDSEINRQDIETNGPLYSIYETDTSKYRSLSTSFIDTSGSYYLEFFENNGIWYDILSRMGEGVN